MSRPESEKFRDDLLEHGVLDPEGLHHEFVSGLHGRKLDFDDIPPESDLFVSWVEIVTRKIHEEYISQGAGRLVLVSVAGGTNRLVPIVASEVGHKTVGVLTEKDSPRSVKLLPESLAVIRAIKPIVGVAIEDAATKGTMSASAVEEMKASGVPRNEVLNTWQRRVRLEELEARNIKYSSIIFEPLPTLAPQECEEDGYCAQGWELLEHDN